MALVIWAAVASTVLDVEAANPLLYTDFSDPDVIRHGNTYYMVSSSFITCLAYRCSPLRIC